MVLQYVLCALARALYPSSTTIGGWCETYCYSGYTCGRKSLLFECVKTPEGAYWKPFGPTMYFPKCESVQNVYHKHYWLWNPRPMKPEYVFIGDNNKVYSTTKGY